MSGFPCCCRNIISLLTCQRSVSYAFRRQRCPTGCSTDLLTGAPWHHCKWMISARRFMGRMCADWAYRTRGQSMQCKRCPATSYLSCFTAPARRDRYAKRRTAPRYSSPASPREARRRYRVARLVHRLQTCASCYRRWPFAPTLVLRRYLRTR